MSSGDTGNRREAFPLDDDKACRETYGLPLATLQEKLRKGEYLDDIVVKLRVGDYVYVYNPDDHNGEYLGHEGNIIGASPEDGVYEMDEVYDETFGEHKRPVLSREEIELLEGGNPHYIEEMKQAPWWVSVAEERTKALVEQGRLEADHR